MRRHRRPEACVDFCLRLLIDRPPTTLPTASRCEGHRRTFIEAFQHRKFPDQLTGPSTSVAATFRCWRAEATSCRAFSELKTDGAASVVLRLATILGVIVDPTIWKLNPTACLRGAAVREKGHGAEGPRRGAVCGSRSDTTFNTMMARQFGRRQSWLEQDKSWGATDGNQQKSQGIGSEQI